MTNGLEPVGLCSGKVGIVVSCYSCCNYLGVRRRVPVPPDILTSSNSTIVPFIVVSEKVVLDTTNSLRYYLSFSQFHLGFLPCTS